jgi:beta-fructofuranosidase
MVRYRKAKSLSGPWIKPKKDYFDGRAFYAAKTASDGEKRYLFGWNPTRENNSDSGNWQWGGNLIVHELVQNEEADLVVKLPESILNVFKKTHIVNVSVLLDCPFATETSTLLENAPETFKLSAVIECEKDSSQFGFLLHHNPVLDEAYGITFNLDSNIVSVNQFPNFPQNLFNEFQLQQPIMAQGKYTVDILVDHDVCVIYVNNQTALSTRFYNRKGCDVSVYSSNSQVQFSNISISTL